MTSAGAAVGATADVRAGPEQADAPPLHQVPRHQHHRQHHPRPHQVELLLHRQRPQVVERRGRGEPGVVGVVLEDVPPVVDVEPGRDDVAPVPGHERAVERVHPHRHHREHHEQRRQQPSRPSHPEVAELDPPGSGELPYQDVGDQIAAEREEHPHAEQSALRPAVAQMVGNDGRHGERAQPVKPW